METIKKHILIFIKNARMIVAKLFFFLAFVIGLFSIYIHTDSTWILAIFCVLVSIFLVLCEIVHKLNHTQ